MAENTSKTQSSSTSDLKSQIPQASGVLKGSFQLEEEGKDKLPGNKWVHWALIIIPVLLLISIVVILYAFFINPEKPGVPQTQTTSSGDGPPPRNATPSPKLIITDEVDKASLKRYFASISAKWNDSLIEKVAADSQVALDEYQNADDEDRPILAKELYKTVSNPGVSDSDPTWNAFLADLKQHLETEVGESFD